MDMNKVYELCMNSIENEFKSGTNDCNINVIKLVDLIAGTELAKQFTYKTVKGGIRQLKALGFNNTYEMISPYLDEVTITIDGDIWIHPTIEHSFAIVISNRLLAVNEEHTEFKLVPKRNDGTYYRIREKEWVVE